MPLQTRVVADYALPMVRDEDDQGERSRAAWSLAGAAALAGLGVIALASLSVAGPFMLLLGAGQLLAAGAVVIIVLGKRTRGSPVHLGAIGLGLVSLVLAAVAPSLLLGEWALPALLLGIAALVGLVVGRR